MSDNNEVQKKSKFNFGSIVGMNADGSDANLNVTEFNGSLSLAIFSNKKLAMSISVNQTLYTYIKKALAELKKASNGSKTPLFINKWDRDPNGKGGKWIKDKTIVFGRTDDGIYFMEFKDTNNAPFKFLFKSSPGFQLGADPSDDVSRSSIALESFYNTWLTGHSVYFLSKLNYTPFKRQGGNNNYRNNSGGGSGPSTKDIQEDDSF